MATPDEKLQFFTKIENLVWEKDISYLEALHLHCETSEIEPAVAASLINKNLHLLLENDAATLNLLRSKKSSKLPV